MIDPDIEQLLTMPEAAKKIPPKGIHISTVWRWAVTGLSDGRQLETVKVGGRVYTSKEAIQRFLETPKSEKEKSVSCKDRLQRIEAAEKELATYGVP